MHQSERQTLPNETQSVSRAQNRAGTPIRRSRRKQDGSVDAHVHESSAAASKSSTLQNSCDEDKFSSNITLSIVDLVRPLSPVDVTSWKRAALQIVFWWFIGGYLLKLWVFYSRCVVQQECLLVMTEDGSFVEPTIWTWRYELATINGIALVSQDLFTFWDVGHLLFVVYARIVASFFRIGWRFAYWLVIGPLWRIYVDYARYLRIQQEKERSQKSI